VSDPETDWRAGHAELSDADKEEFDRRMREYHKAEGNLMNLPAWRLSDAEEVVAAILVKVIHSRSLGSAATTPRTEIPPGDRVPSRCAYCGQPDPSLVRCCGQCSQLVWQRCAFLFWWAYRGQVTGVGSACPKCDGYLSELTITGPSAAADRPRD
jgi:hypothetical protein